MTLQLDTQIRPLRPAHHWVNDGPIPVEGMRGTPVLLHFWSRSVRESVEQLEHVRQWHELWGKQLTLVGVHTPLSVDDMDDDRVVDAIRASGLVHPVALDGDDGALADVYQVMTTPAYFLFDANGRLRAAYAGPDADAQMEAAVARLYPDAAHPAEQQRGATPPQHQPPVHH